MNAKELYDRLIILRADIRIELERDAKKPQGYENFPQGGDYILSDDLIPAIDAYIEWHVYDPTP